MQDKPMLRAMVWYRREEWDRLMEIFTDRDRLPPNYDDWLDRAEKALEQVKADGDMAVTVIIDTEKFPLWCEKRKLPPDAESRSRYAIEKAAEGCFGPRT